MKIRKTPKKKTSQAKRQGSPQVGPPREDASTLSIRLTEPERARVQAAADSRGWTLTTLIRRATLDKAAHIINTSSRNKFDFKIPAMRLAVLLAEEPNVFEEDMRGDRRSLDEQLMEADVFKLVFEPGPLGPAELDMLRKAVRLGGTDFLEVALDGASELLIRQHGSSSDLPDPIDPSDG